MFSLGKRAKIALHSIFLKRFEAFEDARAKQTLLSQT